MPNARFVALLLLSAWFVPAQDYRGSLLGRVTDATGATVPGASISVVNEATNVPNRSRTNEEGNFLVPLLEPGFATWRANAVPPATATCNYSRRPRPAEPSHGRRRPPNELRCDRLAASLAFLAFLPYCPKTSLSA